MKMRLAMFLTIFLAFSAAFVFGMETHELLILTLYMIFPVGAALIGLYTSRIYGLKSANGRALILITGGLVCWAVAETIWYIGGNFVEGGITSPSVADVFFLSACLFFFAGIYQSFITAGIKLKLVKKSLLAIVLSASLILTILVLYFGVYQAYDPDADLLTNTVNISYGLVDLVIVISSMLTILVAKEYGGGKLALFWKTMTAGFLLNLIADIAFAIYDNQYLDGIKPYAYIDLLWAAAYVVIAYAMLENYIHVTAVQKKIKLMIHQRNNPTEASI